MSESTPEIQNLLFETSPAGGVDAIVESDGRTVYFYLNSKSFGLRACWVRNLVDPPLVFRERELESGPPPVLPKTYLQKSAARQSPVPDELKVVWFPEGNGAALLERGELLAAIPPWSGTGGFHGYSRDCAVENVVCWPFPPNLELQQGIARAARYWELWKSGQLFARYQRELLRLYSQRIGAVEQYYATDGGHFPPQGLAQCTSPEGTVLLTVGMALRPQPLAAAAESAGWRPSRAELGLKWPPGADAEELNSAVAQLAGWGGMPWRSWKSIEPGHTLEFRLGPEKQVMSVDLDPLSIESLVTWPELDEILGPPLGLLWLNPLPDRHQ